MKKKVLSLLLIAFSTLNYGQQVTLMDFGLSSETTSGNWNNITDSSTLNSTTNLIDDSGTTTGEVLTLTDPFDDDINGIGTQSPDGSLFCPSSASRDNFFGEDMSFTNNTPSLEPTGGFTLSNLEVGKYYSFKIFASRTGVSDNRETLYTITGNGAPQTATLDATQNTSNLATIFNIQPTNSGEITIQAETGANNDNFFGFYYLGAIEMTQTDNVLSSDSFSLNGLVNIYPNPSSNRVTVSLDLTETANVKMSIYDINGRFVKSVMDKKKQAGSFLEAFDVSGMNSGVYILKIKADDKTRHSKIVVK